jgi:hypothetical protein
MKKFKELLAGAYNQANIKKIQRQEIKLSVIPVVGILYLILAGKTDWFPNSKVDIPVVVLIIISISCLISALFLGILPSIGKVKIKAVKQAFFKLYHKEYLEFEEYKSDIEKNIKLLTEKQISIGKLLDGKLHDLETLLDYQKTLDETSEYIKAGMFMSLQEPLDLVRICMLGISYLDSEDELNEAIDKYSQKLDLVKANLKEEEDRLVLATESLTLFQEEMSPYVKV